MATQMATNRGMEFLVVMDCEVNIEEVTHLFILRISVIIQTLTSSSCVLAW